jgi:SSS family solute:Na+ symporter
MQTLVLVIGLIAYYLAIFIRPNLVILLLTAYAFIDQLAPPVYAALFWKRATTRGVIAGLATGMGVALYFVLNPSHRPWQIHEGILGLVANIGVLVVVSLMTAAQNDGHAAGFVDAETALVEASPENALT